MFMSMYTKSQLLTLLAAWKVEVELPSKNKEIQFTLPDGKCVTLEWVKVPLSTYGERLYRVSF